MLPETIEDRAALDQQVHGPGWVARGQLGVAEVDRILRGAERQHEAEVVDDDLCSLEMAPPEVLDAGPCFELAERKQDHDAALTIAPASSR